MSGKIGFVSLGCPKALVDAERIVTQLRAEGYEIGKDYAGRALAIANYSPELLEAAKDSLDGAYKTYQAEKLKREEDQHRPECNDRREAKALL